jgi:RHS repeat-associated protein
VQWGYNRASQKTWRKDLLAPAATGQDQNFGYDGLYQVTERQRGLLNVNTTAVGGIPAQQENFSYDETGNWITYKQVNDGVLGIDETRVNNRSNQMTQVDGSSAGVSYDKNGNMLTVPTGDGLTGSSRKLEWDAWNRLTKVSDEDDNVLAEYEYDGLSRRTKVKAGGVTRHFYYDDQWRVVEERLDDATTPERQYVWHPTDRWELLFRDRSTANNGTLDERLYSLKDQLDPVAICDTSGSVVERFAYSAFGLPTFLNLSFIPQPSSFHSWSFLFHAEFTDAETGWFNYGYRYYAPSLGRWLSRDPIGVDGGLNLYGFVYSDPISFVDNTGNKPISYDEYWNKFDKRYPGRDKRKDGNRKNDYVRGCVGLVCINTGKMRNFPEEKKTAECYKTLVEAQRVARNKKCDGHCVSGSDEKGQYLKAKAAICTIHLWNDQRNPSVTFDPITGRADTSKWNHKAPAKSADYPFDYGFLNPDGNVEHANHAHGPKFNRPKWPMTIDETSPDEWTKKNGYDLELWCVVCSDEEH